MRERPTFHAEFGEYVRGLRVRLNDAHPGRWTLRGAADLAHRRGLASLTRQILFRLEQGQTRHPDANVLMEVADLYGVPYAELVVTTCIIFVPPVVLCLHRMYARSNLLSSTRRWCRHLRPERPR